MQIREDFVISGHIDNKDDVLNTIYDLSYKKYSNIGVAHHEWIDIIPEADLLHNINIVRKHVILDIVKKEYTRLNVIHVNEADEIYWAVSPDKASGSDRALVDCHYDAPFGMLFGSDVIFYRVIVACNENHNTITTFPKEGIEARMSTGDYHGIDYNNDLHCVKGEIPKGKTRVLLKLHYLIYPESKCLYVAHVRWMNVRWTWISRELMRMSSNPSNPIEYLASLLVTFCRISFNNIIFVYTFVVLTVFLFLGFWAFHRKR
jgi:hypothetical protein